MFPFGFPRYEGSRPASREEEFALNCVGCVVSLGILTGIGFLIYGALTKPKEPESPLPKSQVEIILDKYDIDGSGALERPELETFVRQQEIEIGE